VAEKKMDEKNGQAIFNGDKVAMTHEFKKDLVGTFKVDEKKDPKEIDLIVPKGNGNETWTLKCLYQLKGDSLKIAMSIEGPKGNRPESLDGKDAMLVTFKKK
jgi:uncharacterized protein (TIGR03067 family)